jgi:hypothetical protein
LDYLKNIFFKSLDKDIYIQQIDRKFLLDCIVLAYKKNPQHIKDMIPSLSKIQHVNLFIEILNHSSKDNDYLDILDSLLNMKCFLSSFKALQSNLKYGENTIHNPLFAILLKTNTKLFESSYIDKIIEIYGPEMKLVQQCVKAIGSGSSPWIQLSHFLLNAPRPISE